MNGYTKLFASIVTSTVWEYEAGIKVVWVTMLAIADQHGEVQASVPGLAKMAGEAREVVERALAIFLAPDPDSRTKEHEGRRIVEVDGGWALLNHPKYRDKQSKQEQLAKAAERQQRFRTAKSAKAGEIVTPVTPSNALRNAPSRPSNGSNDIRSISDQKQNKPEALICSDAREGEPGQGAPVSPVPPQSANRGGAFNPTERELAYRTAYESGLRDQLGHIAIAWTSALQGSLNQAVQAHAYSSKTKKALRGDDVLAWVRLAAIDFATHLRGHPDEVKFLSDGEPKGFLRWLNREATTREATRIDGRAER